MRVCVPDKQSYLQKHTRNNLDQAAAKHGTKLASCSTNLSFWEQLVKYSIIFVVNSVDCHLHGSHGTGTTLMNLRIVSLIAKSEQGEKSADRNDLRDTDNKPQIYIGTNQSDAQSKVQLVIF